MTKQDKKIAELEARIRQLEARPVYVPVPYWAQPVQQYPYQRINPPWFSTTYSVNPAPDAAPPAVPMPYSTFTVTN